MCVQMYRGLIVAVLVVCCLTTVGAIRCYVAKVGDGNMTEVDCSKVKLPVKGNAAALNIGDKIDEIVRDMINGINEATGKINHVINEAEKKIGQEVPDIPFIDKRAASNVAHNATANVTQKAETCATVTSTVGGTLLHE